MTWNLPSLTEDDAKALLKTKFGKELLDIAIRHMTFFTFGTIDAGGSAKIRSATCFFLKTPLSSLVVTARHVVRGYLSAKERDIRTQCQIGNIAFDPQERLIAIGEKADIATLAVTDRELELLQKSPISLWPPAPPESDSGVLFAGYPEAEVKMEGPRTGSFGIYTASGVVQTVSDWQLSCKIEREHSFGNLPPPCYDTSGMSGGPMLSIREKNGVLSFPLAGVIFEGLSQRDVVKAERADFIRADGSIRV